MTLGQKLEIHDLQNNQGLLPLQLGNARNKIGHNNFIHIINLQSYTITVEEIRHSLNELGSIHELDNTLATTNLKLNELQLKLNSLLPKRRNKRGLINGLGTAIKFLTGNMDANDAIRLNEQIENVIATQSKSKDAIDRQTLLNNKMIQRFENITNHINSQQKIISNYLKLNENTINNQIRREHELLQNIQFLNQLNYHIDILHDHLSDIAEAIILAKLNIISKQILTSEELSEIHDTLLKQKIPIESVESLYEFLNLQAYINGTNIIFNVQIPTFRSENYSFFHLIPVPTPNHLKIITKPYVILHPNDIQLFDERCPKIGNTFYCLKPPYQGNKETSQCISDLIQNKPSNCEFIEGNGGTEIFQPEDNYILITNSPGIPIESSCPFAPKNVSGTILIHFEGCNIRVNGVTYEGQPKKFWDDITVHITSFGKTKPTSVGHNFTIKSLPIYKFPNLTTIELLQSATNKKHILTFVLLGSQGFIICVVIIYIIYKPRGSIFNIQQSAPATATTKAQFLFPTLYSKGGGVTSTTPS